MMHHTPKQSEIMKLVLGAADEGRFISMRELKSRLSYAKTITNQAMLCSINFLVGHGLVAKVYGDDYGPYRKRALVHIKPEEKAYKMFRPDYHIRVSPS